MKGPRLLLTTSPMPDLALGRLFLPVVMRMIAIANDGVQKRAQDSHSAFNEEKRFGPEVGAVAENADEDEPRKSEPWRAERRWSVQQ